MRTASAVVERPGGRPPTPMGGGIEPSPIGSDGDRLAQGGRTGASCTLMTGNWATGAAAASAASVADAGAGSAVTSGKGSTGAADPGAGASAWAAGVERQAPIAQRLGSASEKGGLSALSESQSMREESSRVCMCCVGDEACGSNDGKMRGERRASGSAARRYSGGAMAMRGFDRADRGMKIERLPVSSSSPNHTTLQYFHSRRRCFGSRAVPESSSFRKSARAGAPHDLQPLNLQSRARAARAKQ